MLVAIIATPALAHAACHNGVPLQSTTPPLEGGTILFEADDGTNGEQFFSFNTVGRKQTEISLNRGLTLPGNPHVSPNGQYVVFAAQTNNRTDVFIWRVGAAQPVNLTGSASNLCYEDPSFTANGLNLVAKQNYNIVGYALSFSDPATPTIKSTTVYATNGVGGTSTEASDPSISPDNRYIYFWRGVGTSENVHYLFLPGKTEINDIPSLALSYFPVVRDFTSQFIVGHATAAADAPDQIYLMVPNIKNQVPTLLPFKDCNSDNSDPGSVDDDHVLYSNDSSGSYRGTLGAIAAAQAWDLSTIGLGAGTTNVRALTYTRFALTP